MVAGLELASSFPPVSGGPRGPWLESQLEAVLEEVVFSGLAWKLHSASHREVLALPGSRGGNPDGQSNLKESPGHVWKVWDRQAWEPPSAVPL